MLEGRDFTIDDSDTNSRSAIVNASFARKYFGNQSALGHQVRRFNPASQSSGARSSASHPIC